MSIAFANQICLEPDELRRSCADHDLPADWWGQANVFRCMQGRGPGAGQFLLTKAQVDAIDKTKDHSLVFFDGQNPERTLQKITLLRATCILPNVEGDPTAPFICELVDRRWHLGRIPINRAYNLKSAKGTSYLSSSTNSGTAWTWATMVQDLFTTLSLGTATLPFTPNGAPENLAFFGSGTWGSSAWDALNGVLARIACVLNYDPESDAFSILRRGVTTATASKASTAEIARLIQDDSRMWDGFHVEPNRGKLPEKVRVLFPRRPQPTNGSSPWYAVDVTLTAATGVVSGSYVQLHDDLTAVGATGTPSNSSALASRASERATDWERARIYAESRRTTVFKGFQKIGTLLSETLECVVYDGRGGPLRTELVSAPSTTLERWLPLDLPPALDREASADCSNMLGLVRTDKCLRMTITEVQGACDCIDTAQTADLTYDAGEAALVSADLLYGCPPGVTTTLCSAGAAKKLNIVVAGFGAPNTNLNQSYTITHTTGEVWAGTKGGVTVTATRISGGWTLSLDDGTVTVTYDTTGMDVCCSTVTFDLLDDDGTTTAPATLSMTVATACGDGPSYTPRLERVSGDCGLCLKFTWVPTAGSGSRVIPWKQVGCGEDADGQPYIEFATDDQVICTGTDGSACTGNKVVVRLTCLCCTGSNPNYFGPGWYKMQSGTCLYLTEDPAAGTLPCSDLATAICSGPWETQPEDCAGPCEITIPGCDCTVTLPGRLCVAVAMTATGSTGLDDYGLDERSFPVTYDPSSGTWKWRNAAGMIVNVLDYGIGGSGFFLQVLLKEVTFSLSCNSVSIALAGNLHTTDPDNPNESAWAAGVTATWVDDNSEFTSPSCLTGVLTANNLACCVIGETVSGAAVPLPGPLNSGMATNPTYSYTVDTAALGGDCAPGEPAVGASWNCIPGVGCVEVFDGSGEYASEAECTASCGGAGTPPSPGGPGCLSCGLLGETPTLVIPDGTYAGTYVADGPWATGAYPGQTTFTVGGSTVEAYCDLGGTAYLGVHPDFGGGAIGGTSSCGPPVVMTFSGTGVGAVGNATVTT